jgi:hypothetical protein
LKAGGNSIEIAGFTLPGRQVIISLLEGEWDLAKIGTGLRVIVSSRLVQYLAVIVRQWLVDPVT